MTRFRPGRSAPILGALTLLLVGLLIACKPTSTQKITIDIDGVQAEVEVAIDQASRTVGLSEHPAIGPDQGLLMVYPREKILAVWMLGMSFPIDVGFFNEQGELLNIHSLEPSSDLKNYSSDGPALYILEMNKGWFEKNMVKKGAKLTLPNPMYSN